MVQLQVAEKVVSRVARIGIHLKAGSRYEPKAHPGISHYLRASAGLTTDNSTIFAITRNLELTGASFNVDATRENIIYRVNCLRENLGDVLPYVCDTIARPQFRPWELVDYVEKRIECDLEAYKKNQSARLVEALHKAGFRGGLAHSLFCPEHQIGKIKREHLAEYLNNNLVAPRVRVVALGVDQSDLRRELEQNMNMSGTFNGVDGATRYVGGEARIQAGFSQTMVGLVGGTNGTRDEKQTIALKLYESILGSFGPPIKYSLGPESSLANAVQKNAKGKVLTKTLNISHSDAGLFGVCLLASNVDIGVAVKHALSHFKSRANVSDKELTQAKHAAKAKAHLQSEDQERVFESIANSTAIEKIDEITPNDIASAVKSVCSKLTIASVGNPRYVPYLDELTSA